MTNQGKLVWNYRRAAQAYKLRIVAEVDAEEELRNYMAVEDIQFDANRAIYLAQHVSQMAQNRETAWKKLAQAQGALVKAGLGVIAGTLDDL